MFSFERAVDISSSTIVSQPNMVSIEPVLITDQGGHSTNWIRLHFFETNYGFRQSRSNPVGINFFILRNIVIQKLLPSKNSKFFGSWFFRFSSLKLNCRPVSFRFMNPTGLLVEFSQKNFIWISYKHNSFL